MVLPPAPSQLKLEIGEALLGCLVTTHLVFLLLSGEVEINVKIAAM